VPIFTGDHETTEPLDEKRGGEERAERDPNTPRAAGSHRRESTGVLR
jgi:hypothetical protein